MCFFLLLQQRNLRMLEMHQMAAEKAFAKGDFRKVWYLGIEGSALSLLRSKIFIHSAYYVVLGYSYWMHIFSYVSCLREEYIVSETTRCLNNFAFSEGKLLFGLELELTFIEILHEGPLSMFVKSFLEKFLYVWYSL